MAMVHGHGPSTISHAISNQLPAIDSEVSAVDSEESLRVFVQQDPHRVDAERRAVGQQEQVDGAEHQRGQARPWTMAAGPTVGGGRGAGAPTRACAPPRLLPRWASALSGRAVSRAPPPPPPPGA